MISVLRAVLCAYLLVWEPSNVAIEALRAGPTLAARGGWAIAELVFHLMTAVLAAVGAIALWNRSPHGVILAGLGVFASTARTLQVLNYSTLPHDTSPDIADAIAFVAIAHGLLWCAFLARYQDQLTDHRA